MSENSGMFERIFLQEAPINHLKVSFAKGRTSQTYLFVGKESCGKFKTALAFAALLQCDNPVYDGRGAPMPAVDAILASASPPCRTPMFKSLSLTVMT